MEERCVMCGDIIPEGRQVCYRCEALAKDSRPIMRKECAIMAKNSIRQAKQRLLDRMAQLEPTSAEYGKLNAELEKLTKSEQNQNGWIAQLGCGLAQTAISSLSSVVNVWSVLRHEDKGNVVTTKSLNWANKPQEHSNSMKK